MEGRHVRDLPQVHVGEEQLPVAAVDDGGSVGRCKHVQLAARVEGLQLHGLRAKRDLTRGKGG